MALHQDTTWDVRRTPEELARVGYNFMEVDEVLPGYPALDARLYAARGTNPFEIERRRVGGVAIRVVHLPGGYDATQSPYRAATLADPALQNEFLFGRPDSDYPTGGDWKLDDNHPAVRRALMQGGRDFTQHLQPLIPGWRQLLALRASPDLTGAPLGMPTGIGWYTHYGLLPMCDAVTMRPSQDGTDIDVLLYRRDPDPQSESVWGTPGGYVIKSDTTQPRMAALAAASARRTMNRTGLDVSHLPGVAPPVKYPVSSGTTLSACLATHPYARYEPNPDYSQDEALIADSTHLARWVSLRAICVSNATGGVSGNVVPGTEWPVWTTHIEYIGAGVLSLLNRENQLVFRLEDEQYHRAAGIIREVRRDHPVIA